MENILLGLHNVLTLTNILAIFIGTCIGLFVRAMPGLSATMAIALLLPVTFPLDPATGISMLASLYLAAMYGGSISAILIRTPGQHRLQQPQSLTAIQWLKTAKLERP